MEGAIYDAFLEKKGEEEVENGRGGVDLAAEGAEAEGVEEAAVADLAGVGDALSGSGLRALVEEDDAGAVDDVRLNAADVQDLLQLRNPDHVVVRRPPYLPRPRNTSVNPSAANNRH